MYLLDAGLAQPWRQRIHRHFVMLRQLARVALSKLMRL